MGFVVLNGDSTSGRSRPEKMGNAPEGASHEPMKLSNHEPVTKRLVSDPS